MARPEQTEKPTGKRIAETRGKGQVAKSPDLAASVIFLFAVYLLHASMVPTIDSVAASLQATLDHIVQKHGMNAFTFGQLVMTSGKVTIPLAGMLFGGSLFFAVVVNVAQTGFLFTFHTIQPNFSKLNPISGFKTRFLSLSVLVQLGKQLAKLSAVLLIVYLGLKNNIAALYNVGRASPHDIVVFITNLIYGIGWRFGWLLFIIALLDYAWERHRWYDSLKMTKQEVKDEHKQSEGSPEAKQATKKRQRETARRRMMAAVPKATVVVTNPTHFAVALEWDEIKMDAPVLTAKGADLLAKRIKDIAKEHKVPVIENPPLARSLYERVELNTAIPPNLYAAVAQLIAFVFKLKNKTIA